MYVGIRFSLIVEDKAEASLQQWNSHRGHETMLELLHEPGILACCGPVVEQRPQL
jgi:hypothetical protein